MRWRDEKLVRGFSFRVQACMPTCQAWQRWLLWRRIERGLAWITEQKVSLHKSESHHIPCSARIARTACMAARDTTTASSGKAYLRRRHARQARRAMSCRQVMTSQQCCPSDQTAGNSSPAKLESQRAMEFEAASFQYKRLVHALPKEVLSKQGSGSSHFNSH